MEVIAVLGEGNCGKVNLCSSIIAGRKFYTAVKSSKNPSSIAALKQEKRFLDVFRGHRQIVQCYGDYSWFDWTKETREAITYTIYLEYVPYGSLAGVISRSGRLPELRVRRYAMSILKGLESIHGMGYVHYDLKPQNILVAGPEEVKIADFDAAKKSGEQLQERFLRGTLFFIAPESVAWGQYEPPADVWSFGCTVLEMLTGLPPRKFPAGIDGKSILLMIALNIVKPEIPEEDHLVSSMAKDFLCRCFAEDPGRRWPVKMLLGHPFISMAAAAGDHGISSSTSSSSMSTSTNHNGIRQLAGFRQKIRAPAAMGAVQ